MRILVTGREGQVVRALIERGTSAGHDIIPLGRPLLDLASNAETIARAVSTARPDAIVSAAAYTAVDQAEIEPERAFAINAGGAGAVAAAASSLGVPLVHLSTDYVFNGEKEGAYIESDVTGPTGVYGRTKLAGEQAVMAAHHDVAILRTAWVYSPFGPNFVKTMLRLAAEREAVGVVADQFGNPTSALDMPTESSRSSTTSNVRIPRTGGAFSTCRAAARRVGQTLPRRSSPRPRPWAGRARSCSESQHPNFRLPRSGRQIHD
jgi:dTDP-4-dehydrorhamnose reductase